MADIELVIKIPEHCFKELKCVELNESNEGVVFHAIKCILNGTPLPKGHGRLIDADTLEECKEVMNTIMNECEYAVRMDEVRNVPTIIKADTAESEDK